MKTLEDKVQKLSEQVGALSEDLRSLQPSPSLRQVLPVPVSPAVLLESIVAAQLPGISEVRAIRFPDLIPAGGISEILAQMTPGFSAVFGGPLRIIASRHSDWIVTSVGIDNRLTLLDNYPLTADGEFPIAQMIGPVHEHIRLITLNASASEVLVTYEFQLLKVEKSVYQEIWQPILVENFQILKKRARGDI